MSRPTEIMLVAIATSTLLTLDQLGRAATLICALELERLKPDAKLGDWPFEIGLWVGQAATPNRMGEKGNNDPNTARLRTRRFWDNDKNPSPIPLEECPWCGQKFGQNSFRLAANNDRPTDLIVRCLNRDCAFSGNSHLPIVAVDEPIYRRLPCFIIATVDKFAALPWTGEVGAFFGRVHRYDKEGFYGPCDPNRGGKLLAEMIKVAGRPILAAMLMLLHSERLYVVAEKERLPAILANSRKYQNTVSTKLAAQVVEALYELLRGFQAADDQKNGDLMRDVLAKDPEEVYRGLLTVLLRLVFVLYAEDRGLLSTDAVYQNYYSIRLWPQPQLCGAR